MSNNNKTFATAILASVAIVMTITALALVSPQSSWDGALLTDSGLDSFVVTTTAIPNSPDAWSAFDAVSDAMSSDWLIPLAFAVVTITDINGVAPANDDSVSITTPEGGVTALSVNAIGIDLTYAWYWSSTAGLPSGFNELNMSAITFTTPPVSEYPYSIIVYVDERGSSDGGIVYINLTVMNSSTTTPNTTIPITNTTIPTPTIVDAVVDNAAPTVSVGDNINVTERTFVILTGIADDPNKGDIPTLMYLWEHTLELDTDVTGKDAKSLRFRAPGISSDTQSFNFTLTVTDGGGLSANDTVTVTVQDVPLKVSYVTYNPGNGQLTITFNQDIDTPDYINIHINGTGSDGIPLSNVTTSYLGRTITAILSSEQKETYADLTGPYLDIASGAVTDTDGDTIDETPDFDIRVLQKKKSSSSSAPIVDLNTLVQARIVDIPSAISEQVSSHNAADPLEPILHDDTFDFPLTINDYYYLLDDTTNTLTPQTVTAGQSTEIEFTVYTSEDLAHFTLYLNLQDDDTRYADSDTYITYTNGGTVAVTDPHGYIADATITVTEEDNSMPEKKTVRITIEFGEEPMGPTNMVAYMWNTDRRAAIVNLIDAIDVTAAAQTRQNSASTDGSSESAKVNPEPDVSDDDRSDGQNSQSVTKSGIAVIGSNADDAQTLSLIRMWSGFASESITDAELLESMGLDNYPVVHIPNWVMTELGALVSNNDVTVKEFRTALVYMLEMLTA